MPDSESVQGILNDAARNGKLGFTHDRGIPTSAYDYLVEVAARRNPDGTPGVGVEDAKSLLEIMIWGMG